MNIERFPVGIDVASCAEKIKLAAAAFPMGVMAHINSQANCAKMGYAAAPDQILEIFRPDYAVKIWSVEKQAGLDIPIRIHLSEYEGKTWVAYRLPTSVFRPWNNRDLHSIGVELDFIFLRLLSALDDVRV